MFRPASLRPTYVSVITAASGLRHCDRNDLWQAVERSFKGRWKSNRNWNHPIKLSVFVLKEREKRKTHTRTHTHRELYYATKIVTHTPQGKVWRRISPILQIETVRIMTAGRREFLTGCFHNCGMGTGSCKNSAALAEVYGLWMLLVVGLQLFRQRLWPFDVVRRVAFCSVCGILRS